MRGLSLAVVGGGPAGLYLARILKLRDPGAQVVVHERSRGSGDTFGFGVGLTESTMRNLEAADPETAAAIRAASHTGHSLILRGAGRDVPLHGARNLTIGRATLLQILADAAVRVGVDYRSGSRAAASELHADVVVIAEGVNSRSRTALDAELGVHAQLGRTRFMWCGADFAVDSAFFTAVRSGEELYVAHAYPYAEDRSTFLIEIDEVTWETGGLAEFDAALPPGGDDLASIERLNDVFRNELGGRDLLANRSRWSRFTNLRIDRWSSGNVVLVGDAAHTAHYTLGSGTKLALEDSIALADALLGEASVPDALQAYEGIRRPLVERFKLLADRSQRWWDSYRRRSDEKLERIALSYMTRAGNLGVEDYASDQPGTVGAALQHLSDDGTVDASDDWVLSRPFRQGAVALDTRELSLEALSDATPFDTVWWIDPDVWGPLADEAAPRLADSQRRALVVNGPSDPVSVGARIDFAERISLDTARPVIVQLPAADRAQGAAAVAAGRCDAIITMR